MIDKQEAYRIANDKIINMHRLYDFEVRIIDEATLEYDFGWVFFYNSKDYLENGNFSSCLAGNAPIIVDRYNGSVHITGTARQISFYVDEYVKKRSTL